MPAYITERQGITDSAEWETGIWTGPPGPQRGFRISKNTFYRELFLILTLTSFHSISPYVENTDRDTGD